MSKRGYSLLELLTVIAILGILVTAAVPAFASIHRRGALRAAAVEVRSILNLARSRAIASGKNCGLKFLQIGGEWHFALYEDGDGDGVRNDDIKRGTDRMVAPPRAVFAPSSIVTIGLLRETIKNPDGEKLKPTQSPVAFGKSAICSFSPLGESTPGTIYLTDHGRDLYAVRVYGATAKVRVLRYDRDKKRWVR